MIESLLKQVFPRQYGLSPDQIEVPIRRMNTPFTETDNASCVPCKANPERNDRISCNEEILRVDNNGKEIAVVRFEDYIKQFKNTSANVKDRCDLLMTESGMQHDKIVFCDLCCHEEKFVEPNSGKYPQGKRVKAQRQMEKSIEVLLEESVTAVNLLTYPEKVCLFAWRDYDVPDKPVAAERGNARANVLAFGTVVSNMTDVTTSHHKRLGHNFTFIQVKYPSVYRW